MAAERSEALAANGVAPIAKRFPSRRKGKHSVAKGSVWLSPRRTVASALKLAPFSLRFQHFAAKAKSEMGNDACENNRVFLASV